MKNCSDCKYFVSRICQKYGGTYEVINPVFCQCSEWESALEPGMNRALMERLAGAVFCALFSIVCIAQGFKAALPHHRVLFILGAVFFAFVSGVLLSRKSN